MKDPAVFLAARLDEEQAAANACADDDGNLTWFDSPVAASAGDHTIRTQGGHRPVARIRDSDSRCDAGWPRTLDPHAVAAHIASQDPARRLREVEAKRKRLSAYQDAVRMVAELGPDRIIEAILAERLWACQQDASVFSDHPDYDPAWGPVPGPALPGTLSG